MNKRFTFVFTLLLVLILSACTGKISMNNITNESGEPIPSESMEESDANTSEMNEDSEMTEENMPEDEESMMDEKSEMEEESMEDESAGMSDISGSYQVVTSATLASAIDANEKNVLFFHAPWCPSCQTLDKAINAELTNIPSDVNILRVDYDSETELKQKYGVTYQHTIVWVDAEGELVEKWSGGSDLDSVANKL